jgi:membrane protein CcdC involved in cytochrome C biogenesis
MPSNLDLLIVPLLVVFLIARLFLRGRNGTNFSLTSIFIRPVIYTLITLAFLLILGLEQDAMLIGAIVIGLLLGLVLGRKSDIFEKDGKVMYKRSNEVTILWLIGFVIRILIDFFYNPALTAPSLNITQILLYEKTIPILFIADILLAFTAGLLLGEAIVLYQSHKKKYPK